MVGLTLFLTEILGNVPYVHLGKPTVRAGMDTYKNWHWPHKNCASEDE